MDRINPSYGLDVSSILAGGAKKEPENLYFTRVSGSFVFWYILKSSKNLISKNSFANEILWKWQPPSRWTVC